MEDKKIWHISKGHKLPKGRPFLVILSKCDSPAVAWYEEENNRYVVYNKCTPAKESDFAAWIEIPEEYYGDDPCTTKNNLDDCRCHCPACTQEK